MNDASTDMASPELERRLVERLLWRGVPAEQGAALRSDAARADWACLMYEAGPALHPMLAHACERHAVSLSQEVQATLAGVRRSASMVALRRRAVLREAMARLDNANISVVVLKGMALAYQVYPAPELRVMNDLDLWIDGASLARAAEVLRPFAATAHWRHDTMEAQCSAGVIKLDVGDPPLLIELHASPASLAATVPLEVAGIWQRRLPVSLGDVSCTVLAPEDQLLHLAVHLAHHHAFIGGLPRLLDVALLLEREGTTLDWDALAARSRPHGAAGWVAATLAAAALSFGASVPSHAFNVLGVPDTQSLARIARDQAWGGARPALNALSVMSAPTLVEQLRSVTIRVRDIAWDSGAPQAGLRPPADVWRRLRLAGTLYAPALVRGLVGRLRGEVDMDSLRRLRRANEELATLMTRAGDDARRDF